jgi:hypothetical protein
MGNVCIRDLPAWNLLHVLFKHVLISQDGFISNETTRISYIFALTASHAFLKSINGYLLFHRTVIFSTVPHESRISEQQLIYYVEIHRDDAQ